MKGWRLKKNLLRKCTPVVSAQLLFLGARFSHSRLRTQNPPLVGILPTLLGVKTKSKKKFLLQMHPRGVGPVAFFRGAILAWEATFISQGSTSSKLGRGSTAPKWLPWRRACMDAPVENLLHWFCGLDVIWCFFSKNMMVLNNRRWHHWLQNKNSLVSKGCLVWSFYASTVKWLYKTI